MTLPAPLEDEEENDDKQEEEEEDEEEVKDENNNDDNHKQDEDKEKDRMKTKQLKSWRRRITKEYKGRTDNTPTRVTRPNEAVRVATLLL